MPIIVDSRTFLSMRTRIADEIKRNNIDSQIKNAVGDAVYFYAQKRFFSNEAYDNTTVMVAGTNIYAGPGDLIDAIDITLKIGSTGLVVPVDRKSLDWILNIDVNSPAVRGQPVAWCDFQNQFRFWPAPDAQTTYTLNFYYQAMIPPPVLDTDQGFWMTTGEFMIRTFAKGVLYQEYFKNPALAKVEFDLSNAQFFELSGQSAAKLFTGQTKTTRF